MAKAYLAMGAAVAVTLVLAGPAAAQSKAGADSRVGAGWTTQQRAATEPATDGLTLDARQIEIVNRVSAYFNGLDNLRGTFVQITADNKRMRGRLFMKKPGRVRFEYAPPSRQLIISDGRQIAIQDLDIDTDDRITVDQTPFGVLLKSDVDLLRDARILEVQEDADLVIVALQDKAKDGSGKVRLFLTNTPALELREWVTTDAQGLDTRLEVTSLDMSQPVDDKLFRITSPTLNKFR